MSMCHWFYNHGETGGHDSVGITVQSFFHSARLLTPHLTGSVWLSHPCRSWCHVVCCWLWWTFVLLHWILQLTVYGSACLGSLAAESLNRACTQLDIFSSPLLAWALLNLAELDWLFCLAHPWLVSCQSTPLFFLTASLSRFLGFCAAMRDALTYPTLCLVSTECTSSR